MMMMMMMMVMMMVIMIMMMVLMCSFDSARLRQKTPCFLDLLMRTADRDAHVQRRQFLGMLDLFFFLSGVAGHIYTLQCPSSLQSSVHGKWVAACGSWLCSFGAWAPAPPISTRIQGLGFRVNLGLQIAQCTCYLRAVGIVYTPRALG